MKGVFGMLKQAARDWSEDDAPQLGAALAYYTIFSIAPLLLIAITIAGLFFGEEAVRGQIVDQIDHVVGRSGAETVQEMLKSARKPETGSIAGIVGFVTLLIGASGVFNQLRNALNKVWEVPTPKTKGILGLIKQRFASFMMILVIGFLLLVSLILSAGLSAMGGAFGAAGPVLQLVNFVVSFAVVTLLFAAIFKILPDTDIEWRDVWFGAGLTSVLFVIGKYAIGLYLGKSSVASAHGAAGSLVVLLVWVYYAAQILFFGAEVTQVYASNHGSRLGNPVSDEKQKADGTEPAVADPAAVTVPVAARVVTTKPLSHVWQEETRRQSAELIVTDPAKAAQVASAITAVNVMADKGKARS
jgi:membrane protein